MRKKIVSQHDLDEKKEKREKKTNLLTIRLLGIVKAWKTRGVEIFRELWSLEMAEWLRGVKFLRGHVSSRPQGGTMDFSILDERLLPSTGSLRWPLLYPKQWIPWLGEDLLGRVVLQFLVYPFRVHRILIHLKSLRETPNNSIPVEQSRNLWLPANSALIVQLAPTRWFGIKLYSEITRKR